MKPRSPTLAALVLAAGAASFACMEEPVESPGLPIIVDGVYDTTVDFSQYQTYDLVRSSEVEGMPPRGFTEANRIAVYKSILDELEARDLVLVEDEPDLRINTFVRLDTVEVIEETWWWESYWGWYWGYTAPWYDRNVTDLEIGTLIIDAVDVGDPDDEDDDVLVFRATATSLIPTEAVDVSERIPGVVAEMFDYWPDEGDL